MGKSCITISDIVKSKGIELKGKDETKRLSNTIREWKFGSHIELFNLLLIQFKTEK